MCFILLNDTNAQIGMVIKSGAVMCYLMLQVMAGANASAIKARMLGMALSSKESEIKK